MGEGQQRRGPGRRAVIAGTAVPLVLRAGEDSPTSPTSYRRPRSDRRPNILFVLTDDHPKETDWALRRTVDWLGGNGVDFARAHANTPLCAPSRASIMSGRYAHHHGVLDTRHPTRLDQHATVQRQLHEAG